MKYFKITLVLITLILVSACSKKTEVETPISALEIEQIKQELLNTKVITLNAKNWEYNQKEIRIKQWEQVTLRVNNTDVLHGIAIPEMRLVWDDEIQVDTSKKWEYQFVCPNYCGDGHSDMTGTIIIE